jgi:hypothetical protein
MLPELSSVCSAIVHIGVLRKSPRPGTGRGEVYPSDGAII